MVDQRVGTAGILRIWDNGTTVYYEVHCSDPQTTVGTYVFYINGTRGTTNLPRGFGYKLLGTRTYGPGSHSTSLRQEATGTQGLGGAGQVSATIVRTSAPPAPSPLNIINVTSSSQTFRFQSNG